MVLFSTVDKLIFGIRVAQKELWNSGLPLSPSWPMVVGFLQSEVLFQCNKNVHRWHCPKPLLFEEFTSICVSYTVWFPGGMRLYLPPNITCFSFSQSLKSPWLNPFLQFKTFSPQDSCKNASIFLGKATVPWFVRFPLDPVRQQGPKSTKLVRKGGRGMMW